MAKYTSKFLISILLFLLVLVCSFALWLLFLGLLVQQFFGITLGDFITGVPFGYGIKALLLVLASVFLAPFLFTILLLRRYQLPVAPGIIAALLLVVFLTWRGQLGVKEDIVSAKRASQKLENYGEEIKLSAKVGAITVDLLNPVGPENTPHYVKQFKEAFQLARVTIPITVLVPGVYRFDLKISGRYPSSRWTEGFGKTVNAADEDVEKYFQWDESLDIGEQKVVHELPAASISRTTSWVREPGGKAFLRLFRIVSLDDRLTKLGTSQEKELEKLQQRLGSSAASELRGLTEQGNKQFTEPVLEVMHSTEALPVRWMAAR